MNLTRNTYVKINLNNIQENVEKVVKRYNNYKYYFGVVKAHCYGHKSIKTVKSIIKGGCNYLAVATLNEGLYIREYIKDIPILCLGIIPVEFIKEAKENNITVTINSVDYMKEIINEDIDNLKIHIKVNTGMNRLGMNNEKEIKQTIKLAKDNNAILEGIYSHIYEAINQKNYEKQIEKFNEILKSIDAENIFKIIHISASDALSLYKKPEFVNGCRLGIIIYGFTEIQDLDLKSTFELYSEVIQINTLNKGDTVGYNGTYIAKENGEKIAVVSIGYADGIIRKNTGRYVYINEKRYQIVGNICMDMLFVKIDNAVKVHDKVTILKDIKHIKEVANYLDTIPYEVLCEIGDRVERKYC